MRRIFVLLTVALVMAAIMVAMAMPAFAKRAYICFDQSGFSYIEPKEGARQGLENGTYTTCEKFKGF